MRSLYKLVGVVILSLVMALSCDSNSGSASGQFSGIYFGRAPRKLRDNQGYFEMWLAFPKAGGGKEWVSILKFDRVEGTNRPFLNDVPSTLVKPTRDLDSVISAAVSIELENDPDPSKPNRIFMSGPFDGNTASLELSGADALNFDLTDTSIIRGQFVLATPSDSIAGNDASGAWFVNAPIGTPGIGPGLKLPTLPQGFSYEGWIATQSETVCISTGRFTRADRKDTSGAGPNGGGAAIPNVPGEDLVFNRSNAYVQGRTVSESVKAAYLDTFKFPIAINRTIVKNPIKKPDPSIGQKDYWDVVVSIEPEPDNDPYEPFAIFPLVKFGPIFEAPNTVINMTNFSGGVAQFITIDVSKF